METNIQTTKKPVAKKPEAQSEVVQPTKKRRSFVAKFFIVLFLINLLVSAIAVAVIVTNKQVLVENWRNTLHTMTKPANAQEDENEGFDRNGMKLVCEGAFVKLKTGGTKCFPFAHEATSSALGND